MKILQDLYIKFRNLILYGTIGSFTSFLDFCIFTCLSQYIGIHYLISNCISVFVGITTSFLLNRAYNFKVKDKAARRFGIFLSVGLCGLFLSNLILWIGIDFFHFHDIFVKMASIVFVVGFQFLLNKFVTFRTPKLNIKGSSAI
jgi:putative flippase GtrA